MVMKAKKLGQEKQIVNRRARFDYELGEELVVGLELTGLEAKSLRLGHASLRGAYVITRDNQLWLLGATITGTQYTKIPEAEQGRSRRLLAKRSQIDAFMAAKKQGNTIIPTKLLTQGRYVKLRIAVGRGKKNYDKREAIKKRDQNRAAQAEMKNYK